MSWHFLQEQEEAYWEGSSLAGGPDALLRLIPTRDGFSSQECETASCRHFQSGTISDPLMDPHGGGTSRSSAVDSPVRISPSRAKAEASKAAKADSGKRWPESWLRWCRTTYSWKMRQLSLLGGSESFSGTWPNWGTMQNGECWAHGMPEHLTVETGSGLWPTPTARNRNIDESAETFIERQQQWRAKDRWNSIPLTQAVQLVPENEQPKHSFGAASEYVKLRSVPTPAATDWKGSSKPGQRRGQLTDPAKKVIPAGGKLNPTWVEWLMAWPIGWTDCEPLETGRWLQWLDSHGER
jgi:hypothetical protein